SASNAAFNACPIKPLPPPSTTRGAAGGDSTALVLALVAALLRALGDLFAQSPLFYFAIEVSHLLLCGAGIHWGCRHIPTLRGSVLCSGTLTRCNHSLRPLAPDREPEHATDERQQNHHDEPEEFGQVLYFVVGSHDDVDQCEHHNG